VICLGRYKETTHKKGTCELCGRTGHLHKHHLDPKKKKKVIKHPLHRDDTAWFDIDCSRMVHALISRSQMSKTYNTVEKLRQHPKIKEYIKWIRRKPIMGLHPKLKR